MKKRNLNEVNCWDSVEPLYIANYLWLDNQYKPKVTAKLFYTKECIHVKFRTYEQNPVTNYFQLNDPICRDSCVEFFLQPDYEKDDRYMNFEMNAAGTLLLEIGPDRHHREFISDIDINIFHIKQYQNEEYWEVEYSIPFTWLKHYFFDFQPKLGHRLKANFYKCGDNTPIPHYACWNMVTSATPDFHRSCDFGSLIFDS